MAITSLTLQQLEIVYTLASTKNFTRTANLLHMTQPGVSAHIKKAEEVLKTTLFKRNKSDLIVTSACQNILPNIEKVFEKLSIIESKTKSKKMLGKDLTGTLKVSLTESLHLWGDIFKDYQTKHPNVLFEFDKLFIDIQLKKLFREEIDIALSAVPQYIPIGDATQSNIKTFSMNQYELVILAAKGMVDFSKSKEGKFNISYLSEFTWLGAKGGGTDSFFLKHNMPNINFIYINDLDSIISAVLLGVGLARVPSDYLKFIDKNAYDIVPVDESLSSISSINNIKYVHVLDRIRQPILIQSFLDHVGSYSE